MLFRGKASRRFNFSRKIGDLCFLQGDRLGKAACCLVRLFCLGVCACQSVFGFRKLSFECESQGTVRICFCQRIDGLADEAWRITVVAFL